MGSAPRRVSELMDGGGLLAAIGLVRQARPGGFCPACRVLMKARDASRELSKPMVTAVVVLAVAGVAWAAMVHHSRAMADMEMGAMPGMEMGGDTVASFAVTWVVMMAAMMLPSAVPVVLEFARSAERRRGWPVATGVLALTYLGVWLIFGVVCYTAYVVAGMPWPNQALVAALALALAGVYSLTPIKRASQARCRELCALHGPLPFNLIRSAAVAGVRYGLSCLGCSAGLMVAMVLIGMSSLWWAVILGIVVLVYKLAPPLQLRYEVALSLGLVALGVAYLRMA
jgi:predicted metal-binding membrane protein